MSRLVKLELISSSMFFIPGIVHLTYENPGPVEIDADLLNPQQKQWINNAHRQQKIKVTNPHPVEAKPQPQVAVATKPAAPSKTAKEIQQDVEQARLRIIGDATNTLKATVPAIQKHVEKLSDIKKLKAMRDLEKEGKRREKVLAALDKRIGEIERAVTGLTGEGLKETDILVTDPKLRNLPEVEESEEDIVTINLGE